MSTTAEIVTGRIGLAAAAALAVVDAVLFALAASHLAGGPSAAGYSLLLAANRLAVAVAVVVAARAVAVVALGAPRVLRRVVRLVVAAAVALGFALTLVGIGSTLVRVDPTGQPVALNSLLFAVWGTGSDLAPAGWVLAVGAALLPLTMVVRDRWLQRRAAAVPLRLVRHPH